MLFLYEIHIILINFRLTTDIVAPENIIKTAPGDNETYKTLYLKL